MPLFPTEQPIASTSTKGAAQRMAWTRELGTRRLVLLFVFLLVCGYSITRVRDYYLLRVSWPNLAPDLNGLSVVGTLDARGDYERNMFRIVQANKEARPELTDFGWRTIFDPHNGAMFGQRAENAIKRARDVNGEASYAILEPFLRAGVAKLMGDARWNRIVSPDYPVTYEDVTPDRKMIHTTLSTAIDSFSGVAQAGSDAGDKETSDEGGGGGGGGHEVEHGMPIPADTLARTCPVVLTGKQFNGASIEEQPATVFGSATYTVHVYLTPEGRSRFFQWSVGHANENLAFVLKHQVLAAGRIQQTMDVSDWQIGPLRDGVSAHALADYVNSLSH